MQDRPVRRPLTNAEKTLADMEHKARARWIWQKNERKKRERKLNKEYKEYLEEQAAKELAAAKKAFYTLQEEEGDYESVYVKEEPDPEMAAEVEPPVAGPFNFVDPGEFHDFKQEPQNEEENPSAEQSWEDHMIAEDAADDFYQLCMEALMPPNGEPADKGDKDIASNPVPEVAKSCEGFGAAGDRIDKDEEPIDADSSEKDAATGHISQPNVAMEESFEDFLILTDPADGLKEISNEVPRWEGSGNVVNGKENACDAVSLAVRLKALEEVVVGQDQVKDDEDVGAGNELVGNGSRENDAYATDSNRRTSSRRSLPPERKHFGHGIFGDVIEDKQESQEAQENPTECLSPADCNKRLMQTEPGSSSLEEAANCTEDVGSTMAAFMEFLIRTNFKKTLAQRDENCDQSSSARLSPHSVKRPHKRAFAKQRHGQTHTEEHPYRCSAAGCAESIARKDHKQTHAGHKRRVRDSKDMRKNKDKSKKKTPCPVCIKMLASAHMKRHLRSHTGERPHPCTFCAKSFRRAQHRRNHMLRVHTGERPFKCDACSAGFVRQCELTDHRKLHTSGDPIFPCETCGRAFSRNAARVFHSKKCQTS